MEVRAHTRPVVKESLDPEILALLPALAADGSADRQVVVDVPQERGHVLADDRTDYVAQLEDGMARTAQDTS